MRKEIDKLKYIDREKQNIIEQLKQEIVEEKAMGAKPGVQPLAQLAYNNFKKK